MNGNKVNLETKQELALNRKKNLPFTNIEWDEGKGI